MPRYGANTWASMEFEAPPSGGFSSSCDGSELTWFSIDGDVFGLEGTVGEWMKERGEDDDRDGPYKVVLLGGWCGDTAEVCHQL